MADKQQQADATLALPVLELRDRLASGALSAVALTQACIARIAAREPEVNAWAWFDSDYALEQARALDALRVTGRPIGPLHGLPVGLKDIIDTAKVPTENGCEADSGRVPKEDAFVVKQLKSAGAIIMGKTVTTELAFMRPSKTRNPHDAAHTAGGSSSGSAAAVAAGMVPLAVGTQTGGSVIRPAAFCGVTGFKPTFGAIPRSGILPQSPSLDTVGVFAADPTGAALLAEVLFGHDAADPATTLQPFPRLSQIAQSKPPVRPDFAFVRPPGWDSADDDTKDALGELVEALGEKVIEVELPAPFEAAARERQRINFAEMARHYYRYGRDAAELLGPEVRSAIAEGDGTLARDYLAARDWKPVLNGALTEIFDRCDAILCPSALGPAPRDVGTTGDPVFNGLWTFCGLPAVALPILTGSHGVPMGVQLVGSHGNDARLMRTARWLYEWADQ